MSNRGWRILVAEDQQSLRKAEVAALAEKGFTVIATKDGEEALRAIQAEMPDLVLLDLLMPGRLGFAVLKEMKQDPKTASIPVIVLTNLAEADWKVVREMGAVEYWVKADLTLEELVGRVEKTLAGGSPVPSAASSVGDEASGAARQPRLDRGARQPCTVESG